MDAGGSKNPEPGGRSIRKRNCLICDSDDVPLCVCLFTVI